MKKLRDLPPRVFPKGAWYYLVRAEGKKRVWCKISKISQGMSALYSELATMLTEDAARDRMPGLVTRWEREVMPRHAEKTQRDERAMGKVVAESFAEFSPDQVTPPSVAEFLRPLRAKPRTHNGYRAHLRELMRYAIEIGMRSAGSNPVTDVRTMTVKARTRYITDGELRRIKVAANYGDDRLRTRSGPMLCALIDMAYLTGQRIGDLLALEWHQVGASGIRFQTSKTDAAVLIEWTPKLQDVATRLKALRKERRGFARSCSPLRMEGPTPIGVPPAPGSAP
jgi:integrase